MVDPCSFSSPKIQKQCFVSHFISKDSTKIGYVASKNLLNPHCKYCIFICPGLSGFAIPFIEWFFDLHNRNIALVSLDYRGFGLSEFDGNLTVYNGVNIDTMAIDMNNLFSLLNLSTKKVFILAHSFGVLVSYNFLNNHYSNNILGFIQVDQSLMNVPQINASDTTYPPASTFNWDLVQKWVNEYQTYSPTTGYYLVNDTLLQQFVVPKFAMTTEELDEWMKYTTNINGNVFALAFKSAMMTDYTYMIDSIFIKNNIPMLIYSGLNSIVPSETQQWIYNKVKNNKLSKLLLVEGSDGGTHTPFLTNSIAKPLFFTNIKKYISDVITKNTYIHCNINYNKRIPRNININNYLQNISSLLHNNNNNNNKPKNQRLLYK